MSCRAEKKTHTHTLTLLDLSSDDGDQYYSPFMCWLEGPQCVGSSGKEDTFYTLIAGPSRSGKSMLDVY